MSWKSTADRYSRMSIALHWFMVLLFVLIYSTIELRGIFPKDSAGYREQARRLRAEGVQLEEGRVRMPATDDSLDAALWGPAGGL